MADMTQVEESDRLMLDFGKLKKIAAGSADVLPVVVQDATTLEVLLIAYVNAEALKLSITEKRAVFYSTSRQEIWRKGESSGDILPLREIRVNCEQNSLLFLVERGDHGACHTHGKDGRTRKTCYYRRVTQDAQLAFLADYR
jgi:phosphoribosyl-AMP cyclohydrolase